MRLYLFIHVPIAMMIQLISVDMRGHSCIRAYGYEITCFTIFPITAVNNLQA